MAWLWVDFLAQSRSLGFDFAKNLISGGATAWTTAMATSEN